MLIIDGLIVLNGTRTACAFAVECKFCLKQLFGAGGIERGQLFAIIPQPTQRAEPRKENDCEDQPRIVAEVRCQDACGKHYEGHKNHSAECTIQLESNRFEWRAKIRCFRCHVID